MDTTKKTIILFSGDFDRVMAALIIANGAAAMGDEHHRRIDAEFQVAHRDPSAPGAQHIGDL